MANCAVTLVDNVFMFDVNDACTFDSAALAFVITWPIFPNIVILRLLISVCNVLVAVVKLALVDAMVELIFANTDVLREVISANNVLVAVVKLALADAILVST